MRYGSVSAAPGAVKSPGTPRVMVRMIAESWSKRSGSGLKSRIDPRRRITVSIGSGTASASTDASETGASTGDGAGRGVVPCQAAASPVVIRQHAS